MTEDQLQPLRDKRQSERALDIRQGTARLLMASNYALIAEFTLASGRRADLIAIDPRGDIRIVEIKSSIADFLNDQKWPEYRDYCDTFYFAVNPAMDLSILPGDAGLIMADRFGADYIRHPVPHPPAAARRKAVTLHFARAAALRLGGLHGWGDGV